MKELNNTTDRLSNRIMEEIDMDSPSHSFKSTLLKQLEVDTSRKATTYVPLISKRTWVGSIVILVFIISFINAANLIDHSPSVFTDHFTNTIVKLDGLNNIIPKFEDSAIVAYSLFFFAFVFILQISSIKKIHNQSLNF